MASVAYSSHSMSPEERNYPIADKEMLSVIRSLEEWRHYLEGANLQFKVWNDHANLQWFMKRQDLHKLLTSSMGAVSLPIQFEMGT